MKRIPAALAFLPLLAAWPGASPAMADSPPKLDVARSCHEAQTFSGQENNVAYKGCMQDENDALAQLQRNWSRYKVENRENCVAQGIAPMPSYVEILTCIEMYDAASSFNRPSDGGLRPGRLVAPPPATPPDAK